MEKREEKIKRKIKKFFKFLGFVLSVSLIILLIFFLVLRSAYMSWKEESEDDLIILDLTEDVSKHEEALEESIAEYNRGEDAHSFIELSQEEALLVFSEAFDASLPNIFEVRKMGLRSDYGEWYVFIKTEVLFIDLPWFGFHLKKEGMQSVDIYIEDVFLGNMSFSRLFLESKVEEMNEGISRSLDLISRGEFLGKEFENIEFTEDSIVIRSEEATF